MGCCEHFHNNNLTTEPTQILIFETKLATWSF